MGAGLKNTIPIKSLSGHFRWVRKNKLKQSVGGMAYILGVTEAQIIQFERGQEPLPASVIREILQAGLFILYLHCHLTNYEMIADPNKPKDITPSI